MVWQGKMKWAFALVLVEVASVVAAAVLWRGAPATGQAKVENKNDEALKRGAYLVNSVAQCANCHTPRNAKGEFDATRHLQGAPIWFKSTNAKFEKWEDTVPDITASGLATKWSEEKLVKLLTSTGVEADAPMPAFKLTVDDARAVVAYLRSLPGKR
jgi:mono/diheme cytochrome c family protein